MSARKNRPDKYRMRLKDASAIKAAELVSKTAECVRFLVLAETKNAGGLHHVPGFEDVTPGLIDSRRVKLPDNANDLTHVYVTNWFRAFYMSTSR